MALATTDDLRDVLGFIPDDVQRADRLLQMASVTVERWCGREFSYVEDDERTVEVVAGVLRLPHPPVLEVSEIVNPDGETIDADSYTVLSDGRVRYALGDRFDRDPGRWWPSGTYTVTYTHGYATIPEDIVERVCSIVEARMSGSTVYQSESLGDWSGTYRENPVDGSAMETILAPLAVYRQQAGRIVTL